MKNEAHARIKINQLLTEAGWRFFDNEEGKANILLENHVKITQQEIDAWGNDYEKTKNGSLIHGELFLNGKMEMLLMVKLWIIIKN